MIKFVHCQCPFLPDRNTSDIGAKTVEEPSMACLLLRHVTEIAIAEVRSRASLILENIKLIEYLAKTSVTRAKLKRLLF